MWYIKPSLTFCCLKRYDNIYQSKNHGDVNIYSSRDLCHNSYVDKSYNDQFKMMNSFSCRYVVGR